MSKNNKYEEQASSFLSNERTETNPEKEKELVFDFDLSSMGNMELQKHLYDTNLKNVFKSYKENVEILDDRKKGLLQDAYYVREMSKKYLGEYASNIGVGDVSGNLLDIYGDYQRNISSIEQKYDMLNLDLEREYDNRKMELFNQQIENLHNVKLEEMGQAEQKILFNAVTGKYPENFKDGFEYLEYELSQGTLSQETYYKAYDGLYQTMTQRITTNIQNQHYEGYDTAEEYLDSFDRLIPEDRAMLEGAIGASKIYERQQDAVNAFNTRDFGGLSPVEFVEANRRAFGDQYTDIYQQAYEQEINELTSNLVDGSDFDEVADTFAPNLTEKDREVLKKAVEEQRELIEKSRIHLDITNPESEHYVGDDFEFGHIFKNIKDLDTSLAFADGMGNILAPYKLDIIGDENKNKWIIDREQLVEDAQALLPEGAKIENYMIVEQYVERTVKGKLEGDTFEFMYMDGKWHRLEKADETAVMKEWKTTSGTKPAKINIGKLGKVKDPTLRLWTDPETKQGYYYRTTDKATMDDALETLKNKFKDKDYSKLENIIETVKNEYAKIHGNNLGNVIKYENIFYTVDEQGRLRVLNPVSK